MIPAGVVDTVVSTMASTLVARWLPRQSDREAVQATVAENLASAGLAEVVQELGSLVSLGFRLRCRIATNDQPRRILVQGLVVGLVGGLLLAFAGLVGLPSGAVRVVAVVVPGLALLVGWFDPRLAVAAAVIWGWRLVALNHGEFVQDLRQLASGLSLSELMVRWILMALGVLSASVVSHHAIRRATVA